MPSVCGISDILHPCSPRAGDCVKPSLTGSSWGRRVSWYPTTTITQGLSEGAHLRLCQRRDAKNDRRYDSICLKDMRGRMRPQKFRSISLRVWYLLGISQESVIHLVTESLRWQTRIFMSSVVAFNVHLQMRGSGSCGRSSVEANVSNGEVNFTCGRQYWTCTGPDNDYTECQRSRSGQVSRCVKTGIQIVSLFQKAGPIQAPASLLGRC